MQKFGNKTHWNFFSWLTMILKTNSPFNDKLQILKEMKKLSSKPQEKSACAWCMFNLVQWHSPMKMNDTLWIINFRENITVQCSMKDTTFYMKMIILKIISTVFQLSKHRVQTKKLWHVKSCVVTGTSHLEKCAHWLVESKIDASTPEFRRVHLKSILSLDDGSL